MNKDQYNFMCLLRNAITPNNMIINEINYKKIETIALNHACLPLICEGTARASINVPKHWEQHILCVAANNYKNLNVQTKIISILHENNIKCAILKGIAVSRCYPEPLYRPLGDIDILVEPDNYNISIEILTGTTQRDSEHTKHKFHYQFMFEGVSIEIHKAITEYADNEYGDMLNKYLANALKNLEIGTYDCFSFPVLSGKFQILSLVLHIQRHFTEHKTTMRMLCDFAMAVRNIDIDNWNNEVYPALIDLNIERFVCALLELCSKHLGMNFKNRIKLSIDKKIVDELLLEFLHDGITPTYIDIHTKNRKKQFKYILITVKEIVNRDFKFVKKLPILLPIFCIYVSLRSLIRKIMGKRKNITIIGYSASYHRRNYICKKLFIR